MEAAAALRSSPISLKLSGFGSRSCALAPNRPGFVSFDVKSNLSSRFVKGLSSFSKSKQGRRRASIITLRGICGIKASSLSSSDDSDSSSRIAPFQLESPVGQFLSQVLHNHPHLLPAAVDQQLEQLQIDREAQKKQEEPPPSGTDLVLYKRIAEVKAKERERALEEILYALVAQKFVEAGVPLLPSLSPSSDPSRTLDPPPSDENKLETVHSSEAYEMIKNHLSLILGHRSDNSTSIAPISKLRVGQVYAASIMFGYFLKRVDQRFQLEKSMKTLPWGTKDKGTKDEQDTAIRPSMMMPDESQPSTGNPHPDRAKLSKLRTYVMAFDVETLQSYATIRSKEAFGIIEKHTEALFGRPEIVITLDGTVDSSKDELVKVSFGGLKRLVLEAVTFGSFLWDVESYVDSRYHFVAN